MSFGYSIGDVIAIAGLIERIVVEVKSYKEAPLHFQRLAIELDFLSKVCLQAFDLRPSNAEDLGRLERVRAIALQCLGPLREFEEKMRGYENTLGPAAANWGGGGKKGFETGRWARAKKRLHWSAIARHEVDELRAILTSEILAINTLLTMQQWKGLEDNNAANRMFADQLSCLMNTTNTMAREIHEFFVSSKATAERLEAAVVTARLAESETMASRLDTIQATTTETSGVVGSLVQRVGHVSSQLTKLFSLTEHLERWIQTIVQSCKDIIGKVQRNTGLLLSLHALVTSLELALRRPDISLPILELENPFGIRMALPYQLCDTWEGMCRMLVVMFVDKPGLRLVKQRQFVLLRAQTNLAIEPNAWSVSVAPGDKLAMSMAIERVKPTTAAEEGRLACPRCNYGLDLTTQEPRRGYTCPQCFLWWSDAGKKISEDATSLSVPRSPPEPVRWDAWKNKWTRRFQQEEARSALRKSALPFERWPAADVAREDSDISSFRRVHVVPFQGNILRSLIDVGTRYRELLLSYAAHFNPNEPQLPRGALETLKGILDEFDTLRKSGIDPKFEVEARQGTRVEKIVLLTWLWRTSDLLRFPLGDLLWRSRVSITQIEAIVEWLLKAGEVGDPGPLVSHDDSWLARDYVKQVYRSRFSNRQQQSDLSLAGAYLNAPGPAGWETAENVASRMEAITPMHRKWWQAMTDGAQADEDEEDSLPPAYLTGHSMEDLHRYVFARIIERKIAAQVRNTAGTTPPNRTGQPIYSATEVYHLTITTLLPHTTIPGRKYGIPSALP